jgi:hypothetical protein
MQDWQSLKKSVHHFQQKRMHRFAKQHSWGTSSTWTVSHLAQQKKEGLMNRSKLIFQAKKKIQVASNCRNANDRACFHSSLCAFTYTHFIGNRRIKIGDFLAYRNACLRDKRTWQERWFTRKTTQLMHFYTWIPKVYLPHQEMNFGLSSDNSVTMPLSVSLEMSKSMCAITIKKPPQSLIEMLEYYQQYSLARNVKRTCIKINNMAHRIKDEAIELLSS